MEEKFDLETFKTMIRNSIHNAVTTLDTPSFNEIGEFFMKKHAGYCRKHMVDLALTAVFLILDEELEKADAKPGQIKTLLKQMSVIDPTKTVEQVMKANHAVTLGEALGIDKRLKPIIGESGMH